MASTLQVDRHFTTGDTYPFDSVAWEVGDIVISVFEMQGAEFPDFWSQRARDIVASKYFRVVGGQKETSARQMITRVVQQIAHWGYLDKYFYTDSIPGGDSGVFAEELTHILLHQYASFNSPVWFNVGVLEKPQTSACFTTDVEDSMESILEWYRAEGMIFKHGSGNGVNLSSIRAAKSPLSSGGLASGVMSFMKVADANAGAIKSGGSTRRAACMRILNADHTEIEDFIICKAEAEKLARELMRQGFGGGIEGGAYDMVPWQNANNSVGVTNRFMDDATAEDGVHTSRASQAYELLYKIAKAAWECGDPGLFFLDTVNKWNTTPNRGSIISSNPCGEFLQPPNSACNLASINLMKFLRDDNTFDIESFCHTVDIMVTALDILIDRSSYPTEAIRQNSKDYRPIGLGFCNLGAFLMAQGLPYDSDKGRDLAAAIAALMTGQAYKRSAEIAAIQGAFTGFETNRIPMLSVIDNHVEHLYGNTLPFEECGEFSLRVAVKKVWRDVQDLGVMQGFRNCQVSCIAPCGTISFMMDCDTTGIEPCLALVSTKKLVGGGEVKMINGVVERALQSLGYDREEANYQACFYMEHGAFDGNIFPDMCFDEGQARVFDTSLGNTPISWQGHIAMVAAVQPFISMGISKTINMPHKSIVQDVFDAYVMAWRSGLKAISIYRDGSKGVQPVTVVNSAAQQSVHSCEERQRILDEFEKTAPMTLTEADFPPLGSGTPYRRRLPDERRGITHKFTINTHEGYLTVGCYDDGLPGELFVRMSKEGSTLGGLMDAWSTMVSIALQYGVPLEVITAKFKDTQFEPRGFTGNTAIKTASSVLDYIARWLDHTFVKAQRERVDVIPEQPDILHLAIDDSLDRTNGHSYGDLCPTCGGMMQRAGSCHVCTVCGTTTGCA